MLDGHRAGGVHGRKKEDRTYRSGERNHFHPSKLKKKNGVRNTKAMSMNEGKLLLRLTNAKGYEVSMMVKSSVQMEKIRKTYCKSMAIPSNAVQLIFEGDNLKDGDTPEALHMEDGDIVEVSDELQDGWIKMENYYFCPNGKRFNSADAVNSYVSLQTRSPEKILAEDIARWREGLLSERAQKRRKKHLKKSDQSLWRKTVRQNTLKAKDQQKMESKRLLKKISICNETVESPKKKLLTRILEKLQSTCNVK